MLNKTIKTALVLLGLGIGGSYSDVAEKVGCDSIPSNMIAYESKNVIAIDSLIPSDDKEPALNEYMKTAKDGCCNVIILKTNQSYVNIVRMAYFNNNGANVNNSDIYVLASVLRDWNYNLEQKGLKNLDSLAGAKLDLSVNSNKSFKVIVPINYEIMGIEYRPIKAKFSYRCKLY